MGASIWLGAVLHRLRHAAGDRAAQLSDAAAMTNEEFIQAYQFGKWPMTDIVERLRVEAISKDGIRYHDTDLVREAAAEIERLRAALQQIADDGRNCADHCRRQARRALEPKP